MRLFASQTILNNMIWQHHVNIKSCHHDIYTDICWWILNAQVHWSNIRDGCKKQVQRVCVTLNRLFRSPCFRQTEAEAACLRQKDGFLIKWWSKWSVGVTRKKNNNANKKLVSHNVSMMYELHYYFSSFHFKLLFFIFFGEGKVDLCLSVCSFLTVFCTLESQGEKSLCPKQIKDQKELQGEEHFFF